MLPAQLNHIADEMSSAQGGIAYSHAIDPSEDNPVRTTSNIGTRGNNILANVNVPPSDLVSFSTIYNNQQTTQIANRDGFKYANAFELLNFINGRVLTSFFEVKPKKKGTPYTMASPFPKKKQHFKIEQSGSIIPFYFYTREEPASLFDHILEEMTKF